MPAGLNRTRQLRGAFGGAARLTGLGAVVILFVAALAPPDALASPPVQISQQSEQILQRLLAADDNASPSERSEVLSRQFLGTPYGANTLIGSATEPEVFVVELETVDCFTYADYVEALKRAGDRQQFLDSLRQVRYQGGVVAFQNRKHFFTDWSAIAPAVATDITKSLSANSVQVTKNLNQKDSGGVFLTGLPVVSRTISYIPSQHVDSNVVDRLHTGDYLGAYAHDGGLDVTHVGIFIDTPDGPVFRNASSLRANNKVTDTPLHDYLRTVPGVVVLRPVQ